ncbi:MAG: hypothetical protein IBJ03_08070 [Gemmatimonadaceae bacterium]|nr:hypothetical protein [Gemmatimonadaceae bacterium]
MDCKNFRKHHLGYLDDTLPGTLMAAAQRHIMACNSCAAHDALVRRSLMVVKSLPTLEPSADFQARLRARLAECREEQAALPQAAVSAAAVRSDLGYRVGPRQTRAVLAVAASAMLGVIAWRAVSDTSAPEVRMAPVIASTPAMPDAPYVTAELLHAMATGNPVWSAAMMVDDVPVTFVNASYTFDGAQ